MLQFIDWVIGDRQTNTTSFFKARERSPPAEMTLEPWKLRQNYNPFAYGVARPTDRPPACRHTPSTLFCLSVVNQSIWFQYVPSFQELISVPKQSRFNSDFQAQSRCFINQWNAFFKVQVSCLSLFLASAVGRKRVSFQYRNDSWSTMRLPSCSISCCPCNWCYYWASLCRSAIPAGYLFEQTLRRSTN